HAPDNPNHPEDPDCGGKGIRNSPIPSIKAPTEDDPYPNDPPMAQPCEGDEEEEPINEEISGTFVGEIIVDKTITRNDLTNCVYRSEEHTSELQSRFDLVCRLLLEKKKKR